MKPLFSTRMSFCQCYMWFVKTKMVWKREGGERKRRREGKWVLILSGTYWVLKPLRGKLCHLTELMYHNHLKMIWVWFYPYVAYVAYPQGQRHRTRNEFCLQTQISNRNFKWQTWGLFLVLKLIDPFKSLSLESTFRKGRSHFTRKLQNTHQPVFLTSKHSLGL